MKAERNFPKAVITKKGSLWLKQGHVWVYEDEVIRLDEGNENGALTDIVSDSGTYLGTGFLSKKSKIRIRENGGGMLYGVRTTKMIRLTAAQEAL